MRAQSLCTESQQSLVCCSGAPSGRAWTLSILKSYWLDNAAAIPPEQLGPEAVVYAHELYPDLKFMSVEKFYRSQAAACSYMELESVDPVRPLSLLI